MAAGDYYRGTVMATLHGQSIQNVFHYRVNTAPGGDQTAAFSVAFQNIGAAMKEVLSNEWVFVGCVVQKFYPTPPEYAIWNYTGAGAGEVAENSLPTTVAATITKQTLYAGRLYRGRSFIAGLPVTYDDDSLLSSAAITALTPLATLIGQQISYSGYTFDPIIYHRVGGTHTLITQATVRAPLRVQRRREVGRGI